MKSADARKLAENALTKGMKLHGVNMNWRQPLWGAAVAAVTEEISAAVQRETERCIDIAQAEYVRWREPNGAEDQNIEIGGMGAAANIVAAIWAP